MRRLLLSVCAAAAASICFGQTQPVHAQSAQPQVAAAAPPLIGMGDSLGEGVQSLDSNIRTQPNSYLSFVAQQMGVTFALPLVQSSPGGVVGSTSGRSRIAPNALASNLAVSGASTTSILMHQSGGPDETGLVLSPRTGTQMSIAESLKSPLVICWVGNTDVLGTVTSFDHLDASQITPEDVFRANYDQITSRLGALGGKVVYATIPDVTQVALLFSPQDLVTFLGSDYGLPSGSYTSAVAMLLIKLGLNDGSILKDPNWVLDPNEIQKIRDVTATFNGIITDHAAMIHAAVVDVNTLFNNYVRNPPLYGGITLTRRYLGGLFSLDGVHPSNIGHALLANAFIAEINSHFDMSIPLISQQKLNLIFDTDPFVDFNGNLRVRGRFGAGLLETLGPFLGISGDQQDFGTAGVNNALGQRFMHAWLAAKGANTNTAWTQQDAIEALHEIFAYERVAQPAAR